MHLVVLIRESRTGSLMSKLAQEADETTVGILPAGEYDGRHQEDHQRGHRDSRDHADLRAALRRRVRPSPGADRRYAQLYPSRCRRCGSNARSADHWGVVPISMSHRDQPERPGQHRAACTRNLRSVWRRDGRRGCGVVLDQEVGKVLPSLLKPDQLRSCASLRDQAAEPGQWDHQDKRYGPDDELGRPDQPPSQTRPGPAGRGRREE